MTMKLLFLIPPSEGKLVWGDLSEETTSFSVEKPLKIAKNATKKDLKCDGKRYEEWILLNTHIEKWPFMKAIKRYNGEMFKAINYEKLSKGGKHFFEENFLILSGMYGLVTPCDTIGNYKLPIETKWLIAYWKKTITKTLNSLPVDAIINLLPKSYEKCLEKSEIVHPIVNVYFMTKKGEKEVKMAHGSKKVKGELVRNICEKQLSDFNTFWGKISQENWLTRIDIYENSKSPKKH